MVFDISQRISSARTAARAIVVEKVIPAILRVVSRGDRMLRFLRLSLGGTSPERIGKILWSTIVDTRRKVAMNGREENATVVGAGVRPLGPHSSQSLLLGSIDQTTTQQGHGPFS